MLLNFSEKELGSLLFERWEKSLLRGNMITNDGLSMLFNIYNQLPSNFDFKNKYPLLNELLGINCNCPMCDRRTLGCISYVIGSIGLEKTLMNKCNFKCGACKYTWSESILREDGVISTNKIVDEQESFILY